VGLGNLSLDARPAFRFSRRTLPHCTEAQQQCRRQPIVTF
jgi:hypothetical protein